MLPARIPSAVLVWLLICNLRSLPTGALSCFTIQTDAKHFWMLCKSCSVCLLLLLLLYSCQMTVSDSFCSRALFRLLLGCWVFWKCPFARRSSANNKHKQFIVGVANKSEKRLIKLRTQVQGIKYTSSQLAPRTPHLAPSPLPLLLVEFIVSCRSFLSSIWC